ncbi:hypothetical protein [Sphingobacterium sp.]|uniref:hypothetical protein n=1 Tax=Sphingobacterium sp. TaxID=341027 RepID=UPI00289758CD|nr:hypothetical protein [Sphingobacterium sp.]
MVTKSGVLSSGTHGVLLSEYSFNRLVTSLSANYGALASLTKHLFESLMDGEQDTLMNRKIRAMTTSEMARQKRLSEALTRRAFDLKYAV